MQDSKGREYLFKLEGLPSNFPTDPFPTPEEDTLSIASL